MTTPPPLPNVPELKPGQRVRCRGTCPSCGATFPDRVNHRGVPTGLPYAIRLCPGCGALSAVDRSTLGIRPLTREERAQLPSHPNADIIRQAQADVVRRMIG